MAVGALDKWILWTNGVVTRHVHYVFNCYIITHVVHYPRHSHPTQCLSYRWYRHRCLLKGIKHCQVSSQTSVYHLVTVRKEHSILTSSKYFTAKNMSREQTDIFMEERKWHYRGWFITKDSRVWRHPYLAISLWVCRCSSWEYTHCGSGIHYFKPCRCCYVGAW